MALRSEDMTGHIIFLFGSGGGQRADAASSGAVAALWTCSLASVFGAGPRCTSERPGLVPALG